MIEVARSSREGEPNRPDATFHVLLASQTKWFYTNNPSKHQVEAYIRHYIINVIQVEIVYPKSGVSTFSSGQFPVRIGKSDTR